MPSPSNLGELSIAELRAIVAEKKSQDPETVMAIFEHIAERAYAEEDYQSMEDWFHQLSEYADEFEFDSAKAHALYKIGFSRFLQDKNQEAILAYSEAEAIYVELFDDIHYFECMRAKIDAHFADSEYQKAISLGEELLEKSLAAEQFQLAGNVAFVIAKCYDELDYGSMSDLTNSYVEAATHYAEEAKQHFMNAGESSLIAEVSAFLADLDVEADEKSRLRSIEEAIFLLNEKGNLTLDEEENLADYYETKARIHLVMDNLPEARANFRIAISNYESLAEKSAYNFFRRRAVCYWQLSIICRREEDLEAALEEINSALNFALLTNEEEFYFRLVEDQAFIYFHSDKEALALRACNDAIDRYEIEEEEKPFGSWLYFGFLMLKTSILIYFDLWREALDTLKSIESISDYLVPMNRAIRIDVYRARCLYGLDQIDKSYEILESVLVDFDSESIEGEDIADAFEIRGRILINKGEISGVNDINKVIAYHSERGNDETVLELQQLISS